MYDEIHRILIFVVAKESVSGRHFSFSHNLSRFSGSPRGLVSCEAAVEQLYTARIANWDGTSEDVHRFII